MLVFSDILWPLQNVTPLITEIYSMHSIMSDYKSVLEAPENSGELPIKHFESLTFKGASLGYETAILNQVEISIEPGQHTLIIGPSGAGKSTLLKTIPREIDVLDGEVLMNGKAIGNYDLDAYYQQLSIVDQVGFIFSGTVQENVSMLNMNPVDQVLNQVSLESLSPLMQLLNNGSNISGGQRARLLLARALNFKKELIICDEILSSLDHDVAKSIERDLIELSLTLINVSHIVFVENLHYYKQFVIVDKGRVTVTQDLTKVMARMIDSDIEFN